MNVYERLNAMGIALPSAPPKGGLYSTYRIIDGNSLYISGCGPAIGNRRPAGKLKQDLTVEQGKECARDCMLNVLAVAQEAVGDLNRVRPLKVLTIVAGTEDFYDQPRVADGGCALLRELYGEDCLPVRSAAGASSLAGNIPVETEAIFEIVD